MLWQITEYKVQMSCTGAETCCIPSFVTMLNVVDVAWLLAHVIVLRVAGAPPPVRKLEKKGLRVRFCPRCSLCFSVACVKKGIGALIEKCKWSSVLVVQLGSLVLLASSQSPKAILLQAGVHAH